MAQEKTGGNNLLAGILITAGFLGLLGSAGADDYETEANYRFETTGNTEYDITPRNKKSADIINWASAISLVTGGLLLRPNKDNGR